MIVKRNKKYIIVLCITVLCLAFTTDVQKRIVREKGFDVECYISLKKLRSYDAGKTYYWFKSGGIHQSLGNAGGHVLHNLHLKYYRSNQLAEKGAFKYGLKTGAWKSWDENGQLLLQEQWHEGFKHGEFIRYDVAGNLVAVGAYKNNLKTGRWINYKTKDTTYHKNDAVFNEKPKNLLQRILRKKDSLEKAKIKHGKIARKRADSLKRAKSKSKKLFLKRKDSIRRSKKKFDRRLKKKQDSIDRINKKQKGDAVKNKAKKADKGFFKRLFKKDQ